MSRYLLEVVSTTKAISTIIAATKGYWWENF
jgi:hypothetical protein